MPAVPFEYHVPATVPVAFVPSIPRGTLPLNVLGARSIAAGYFFTMVGLVVADGETSDVQRISHVRICTNSIVHHTSFWWSRYPFGLFGISASRIFSSAFDFDVAELERLWKRVEPLLSPTP